MSESSDQQQQQQQQQPEQLQEQDQAQQQQQLEQLKLETSQSIDDKLWTDQGINELIVQKIRLCITNGRLASTDIDSRVCEQLRVFPNDQTSIDSLFDEFNNADLTGVVNKSAFLCSLIKQWKLQHPEEQKSSTNNSQASQNSGESGKHKPGPDEARLKQILDRTGYKMEITAGQRKYGGPPPDGPDRPANNSEVFVGKIPREVFEDELIPLCEEAGKIWDLRLMIDPVSGFNKGYCFVTYCSSNDSNKACEKLNGYAIRPGKLLKANTSVANLRLFIGNIPKTKSKEEIQEELGKVVEGVTNVIIYTPADEADKKKNRGFCFVDFDTHKNASVAKRKLSSGRVRVFNRDIAVDWADPDEEPDDEVMSKVKVLYVRNLTSDVGESDVKDLFLPYGNIERVRKVRDYAFVHFEKRDDALNAMKALNGKTLGRNAMEVSLAKPLGDKRKHAQVKRGNDAPPPTNFGKPQQRPPINQPDNSMNYPNFGAFGDFSPVDNAPPRGGPSNRGNTGRGGNRGGFSNNRGGGFGSGNRGGGNFNHSNRGGFNNNNNNNNNNYSGFGSGGNFQGPPQGNNFGGGFNNGSNNQGGFGAFNGPQQNNNNNNSQYGRMNMNNSGYGMNQMQQNRPYGGGGMKRPTNSMNDNMMSKRPRPDTGSWGAMSGNSNDGSNNMNKGGLPQQQQQNNNNNRGNWHQDQGYNSQQQSNYSWN